MNKPTPTEMLDAALFQNGLNTYAVLDGASVNGLLPELGRSGAEYVCLYRGPLEADLARAAPYLVRIARGAQFTEWIIREGWGRHWGIFALSEADLMAMRQHFRRFLTVHDQSGTPLLFRYYDPRVLRVYLSTCNSEESTTFFGPVEKYVLAGDTQPLGFKRVAGELKT